MDLEIKERKQWNFVLQDIFTLLSDGKSYNLKQICELTSSSENLTHKALIAMKSMGLIGSKQRPAKFKHQIVYFLLPKNANDLVL